MIRDTDEYWIAAEGELKTVVRVRVIRGEPHIQTYDDVGFWPLAMYDDLTLIKKIDLKTEEEAEE